MGFCLNATGVISLSSRMSAKSYPRGDGFPFESQLRTPNIHQIATYTRSTQQGNSRLVNLLALRETVPRRQNPSLGKKDSGASTDGGIYSNEAQVGLPLR